MEGGISRPRKYDGEGYIERHLLEQPAPSVYVEADEGGYESSLPPPAPGLAQALHFPEDIRSSSNPIVPASSTPQANSNRVVPPTAPILCGAPIGSLSTSPLSISRSKESRSASIAQDLVEKVKALPRDDLSSLLISLLSPTPPSSDFRAFLEKSVLELSTKELPADPTAPESSSKDWNEEFQTLQVSSPP